MKIQASPQKNDILNLIRTEKNDFQNVRIPVMLTLRYQVIISILDWFCLHLLCTFNWFFMWRKRKRETKIVNPSHQLLAIAFSRCHQLANKIKLHVLKLLNHSVFRILISNLLQVKESKMIEQMLTMNRTLLWMS